MKLSNNKIDRVFEKINKELSPNFKGKIVAIDPNSGSYFIGDSELDAYQKAIKEYPKIKFVFKRVGFKTTYFVGAL
ncbi:hypothetical protein CL622_02685 [archaeon]|nr:hypothetical protein [archaeon]|tara:strand:- start:3379 stop:3606 length:228 start_codon:yes stop_codon:yes gene_type:complete